MLPNMIAFVRLTSRHTISAPNILSTNNRCYGTYPMTKPGQICARPVPARNMRPAISLMLLGDNLILDPVIDGLRNDFLLHELVLALVGTVFDYGVGPDIADAL